MERLLESVSFEASDRSAHPSSSTPATWTATSASWRATRTRALHSVVRFPQPSLCDHCRSHAVDGTAPDRDQASLALARARRVVRRRHRFECRSNTCASTRRRPSAWHGPGQEALQLGKHEVGVRSVDPVGNYAVRIVFDDATTRPATPGDTCTSWVVRTPRTGSGTSTGSRSSACPIRRRCRRNVTVSAQARKVIEMIPAPMSDAGGLLF